VNWHIGKFIYNPFVDYTIGMTVISLLQRRRGAFSRKSTYQDTALQTGGIAVDQDAFTTGLDRIYDVRGLATMHAEIENEGGSNGLTYKIEKARKEFADIADLVDADFDEDILGDTNVANSAIDIQDIVDISPETTAIRIRIKRQTAGQDTTLGGIVAIN